MRWFLVLLALAGCDRSELKDVSLLGDLRVLAIVVDTPEVAPGTVVIHEGEEGRGLFVVLSGELDVSRRTAAGDTVPLGGLKTGDVFGEMALLRGNRTTATVVATRPATVLFLARDFVARMVAGMPEIKSYLEALAEEREIDNQLVLGEDEPPADERILI